MGRYNESILAYNKAIELDPRDINVWNSKVKALKALGRNTEAETEFAKGEWLWNSR